MRSTKRSTATEAIERYYSGLRRLVDEQGALESVVAGLADTPTGCLLIAAPIDFGARFVAPVIAYLQGRYSELVVDLVPGNAFADMTESDIDFTVLIGQLRDSGLIAKRIGNVPRVKVGSRAFVANLSAPTHASDLAAFPFVFY